MLSLSHVNSIGVSNMQEDDADKLLTRAEVEVRFGLSRRFLEVAAVKGNGPAKIRNNRVCSLNSEQRLSAIFLGERIEKGRAIC